MESNSQTSPNPDTPVTPLFPLSLSGFNCSARAHRFFSAAVVASIVVLMCLTPTASSTAPLENKRPDFADAALPEHVQPKHGSAKSWARGRILVAPRAGLPAKAFANILEEYDGKARKIGQSNLYIVDLPEYSEEGVIARLAHHPHLKFVELDHSLLPSLIPNDPYYGVAWHLPKIGAPVAWDVSLGTGHTIAILDSGVESTQPDLAAQIVPGWNFYDNNSDTSAVTGHGTIVAGAAAAITNNNIGVAGVAPQSKIMPLRVTDTNGYGYSSTIAQGLTYAADRGARIANASFRGLSNSLTIQNAAQYMKDKGGLVTVSAGNSGALESYSATTTMIPVSATDEDDLKSGFSSYGNYVALAAPGSYIWSTWTDARYIGVDGTSLSSPVVAGVVALMMSANPTLSSTEIENLLFSTAVDLGDPGRDPYYGYGRVDAAAAVQAAITTSPSLDTEAPTASIVKPSDGATVAKLVAVDIDANDNIGVSHVELWVNNSTIAVDTSTPYAFSWDSSGAPNGATNLVAKVFDAAGNMSSSSIEVNVNNVVESIPVVDTEAPIVNIINPVAGNVNGNVTISVDASDDSGAAGILLSIYIDDTLETTGTGSTLAISWNTRSKRVTAGTHTIRVVAKDDAGNNSSASVDVNVNKK